MKALRWLLYLLVLLLLMGLILPTKTQLQRSVTVAATAAETFAYLENMRNFNNWSPWHALDPDTRYEFSGPESGVGAKMAWASDDEHVGQGSQEITNVVPGERIDVALDFVDMGTASASYLVSDAGEGKSTVVWAFEEDHGWSLTGRYMGFFMLDYFLGPMYEQGLASLKQQLEAAPLVMPEVSRDITTEEISYQVDGESFTGYLAHPAEGGPQPAVLVVHEWWGHNDYARHRAEMLAREGYTAFALDMYGTGKQADHPDDAMAFMNAVFAKEGAALARFTAALELVKAHKTVDPERVAAIGYCFGGATVLNMARAGLDLDGVASFHGTLATQSPARPGEITARVQVYHGNADPFVPPEQVAAFKQEMSAAGVLYDFVGYDGVKHAFTNPAADSKAEKFDMPVAYDPQADADSWQRMLKFFEEIFKN